MDREILFRGRYKKGSKWFFGDLLDYAGEAQIWYLDGQEKWNVLVDPSTVGQYTGLTDKNSAKVFEGDLAQYDDELVVVEWGDQDAMFYVRSLDGTNWVTNFSEISGRNLEVIGNIHDNPELLEAAP